MKPKLYKNLSLPWTPQGEKKASGNHQITLPREESMRATVEFERNFWAEPNSVLNSSKICHTR